MCEKTAEFSALSDEQLVALAREGSNECFELLYNKYLPLITGIAGEYEDVSARVDPVYAGNVGFAGAVMAYDSARGASFKTFARHCITARIADALAKEKKGKRVPPELVFPLDDISVADSKRDPERMFIEKEQIDLLFKSIKARLSDYEYRVFCEVVSGKSYKEIAAETGADVKSLENALARARKKISGIKI